MKTRLTVFAAVIGFITLTALGACAGLVSNDETIRYKITVTIETPEGDKVGSAVREAYKHTEKSILPDQGGAFYGINKGEAVIVDLGSYGLIFGLMTNEGNEPRAVFHALADDKATTFDLPPKAFPRFVRFDNLHDLYSVKAVPFVKAQDAAKLSARPFQFELGHGIYLKSVHVEITKEAVIWRVDDFLPWLKDVKKLSLDGKIIVSRNTPLGLEGSNFQRGEK